MRLTIDHRTTYRFSAPQGRLTQMLRLTPEDTDDQTVAEWQLHVDCDARLRPGRDGFGNKVTMLYVEGPIDGIEIAVSGEVLTNSADGVVHGTHEVLPPALYLRSTPLTLADPAITAFADDAAAGSGDVRTRLQRLNAALSARITADRGRPVPGLTAAAAFADGRATPRDLAHIFLAGARSLGIPARYVSGYSTHAFSGEHRPAPHGWAEAFVAGMGWVAFDPCSGRQADEAYVRVAVALDAAGAAPVAGSRLGVAMRNWTSTLPWHRRERWSNKPQDQALLLPPVYASSASLAVSASAERAVCSSNRLQPAGPSTSSGR